MTINGNGGDDTIRGGLGNDIRDGGINGMAGDTLSFAGFAATVGTTGITVDLNLAGQQNTGAGLDTITGFENVIGSDYDDTIRGDANRNSLYGGGGNDTIISNSDFANIAGETIDGGMGDDTLRFAGTDYEPTPATHDFRDDTITSIEILQLQDSGYYGARSIFLNADQFGGGAISSSAYIQFDGFVDNTETINIDMNGQNALDISGLTFGGTTSTARFDIVGGGLAENITGSSIRDIINGGAGADTLNGGGGNDTIDGGTQGDTINGGDGEDILNGGQGADTINGGDDNDTIDGGLSSGDILNGEGGDDYIFGGAGNDTIDGGTGVDTVDYSGFGGNVTVNLNNNGSPQTAGGGGVDVINNVENIMAGDFAGRLTGRGGDSEIHGGAGGDRIFGIGGDDMLFGEGANDFIQGGNGDDMIYGGDGQDQLDGGNNNDMLFGGDDNSRDRLTGAAGDDVLDGGGGRDILRGDSISGGVVVTGGADIFDFNEVNDSLAGGSHTIISADVDGDGVADFQIDLNGNVTLTSSDFVFAGPL